MTRTFTIENGQKPTEEQLKEVQEAQMHPITFDEDCQELSPALMKALKVLLCRETGRKKLKQFQILSIKTVFILRVPKLQM